MTYAQAQPKPQLRLVPTYTEVANEKTHRTYTDIVNAIFVSREGSEYARKKFAEVDLGNRLHKLASLRNGWDSYDAEAPSQQSIATASMLAKAFINAGLIPDAIVPSAEGGVAICFVRNRKYADIECFNNNQILAVRYSQNDDPRAWSVSSNSAATDEAIQSISEYLSI